MSTSKIKNAECLLTQEAELEEHLGGVELFPKSFSILIFFPSSFLKVGAKEKERGRVPASLEFMV